jgi:hypothetical protein
MLRGLAAHIRLELAVDKDARLLPALVALTEFSERRLPVAEPGFDLFDVPSLLIGERVLDAQSPAALGARRIVRFRRECINVGLSALLIPVRFDGDDNRKVAAADAV